MNRLRDLREDRDMSQKELAAVLNMSQTGYSKYEVGTNDIPTEVLRKLSEYYKTSVDYILYLTDERKPYPRSIMNNGDYKYVDNVNRNRDLVR